MTIVYQALLNTTDTVALNNQMPLVLMPIKFNLFIVICVEPATTSDTHRHTLVSFARPTFADFLLVGFVVATRLLRFSVLLRVVLRALRDNIHNIHNYNYRTDGTSILHTPHSIHTSLGEVFSASLSRGLASSTMSSFTSSCGGASFSRVLGCFFFYCIVCCWP